MTTTPRPRSSVSVRVPLDTLTRLRSVRATLEYIEHGTPPTPERRAGGEGHRLSLAEMVTRATDALSRECAARLAGRGSDRD